MENPRRRGITLTHWLLIVIIAALIANAALQTISIMQRNERAIAKFSREDEAERARWLEEIEEADRKNKESVRKVEKIMSEMLKDGGELDIPEQESSPKKSNGPQIQRLVNRVET